MKCDASTCRAEATQTLANREYSRHINLTQRGKQKLERGDHADLCAHHHELATRPALPHLQSDWMRTATHINDPEAGAA